MTRHTDNFSVCHKEQNMRKYWFAIDEKVRFAIMASVNMALRFMIFSGLALLFLRKDTSCFWRRHGLFRPLLLLLLINFWFFRQRETICTNMQNLC